MIGPEQAEQLRAELLSVLAEDSHNTARLLGRLDALTRERGVSAHAALLAILTQLTFEESEARAHWAAILAHRDALTRALGRDPGVRVALLDHFLHENRKLGEPTLVDLQLSSVTGSATDVDALTGLATPQRLERALQAELRRARRYELDVGLVVLDLDRFGDVNGRVGRLVGDRLLRELAILLNNGVRDIDLTARIGDDTFAVLLPETRRNGALLVAERFRKQTAEFFAQRASGGEPVRLTVSVGVAWYPGDGADADELLARAMRAVHQAKAQGGNTVSLHHPERRRFVRFELEPGRFEVEVLAPRETSGGARNLSRSGLLFASPERLEVGESIELRLVDDAAPTALRLRGQVVRLEELAEDGIARTVADRYDVGIAFDLAWDPGAGDLLAFLERVVQGEGHQARE